MEGPPLPPVIRLLIALALCHLLYAFIARMFLQPRRTSRRDMGTMLAKQFREKDPILGLDLLLANIRNAKSHTFLEMHRTRHTRAGSNTIKMRIGRRCHISTLEPENLKAIQATDFKKWGIPRARKRAFRAFLGEGIFITDGPEWQHSRNMLRPNFVRSQVSDLDMFEKHVLHVIAAVPVDGSTVDLTDLFYRLTFDSATELLFGESTNSLTKGAGEGFAAAFTASQQYTLFSARWGLLARWISPVKTFERDVEFVHRFVDRYVMQALEQKNSSAPDRYLFIDELIRHTRDPVRIRSELLNVLLAGRDTTASLLTNIWWQLAQRPDVWANLQAEVATLDHQRPSFERFKQLRYLRAVVHESLRLHPVLPLNSREALEDATLPVGGGPDGRAPVFVPKGERVQWSVYAMHRRADLYGPDADQYRPERWLDDDSRKGLRPGWEYLPFNGGARICLGQQYALTEASYTTVRLCQAFDGIENRGATVWTEKIALTCTNLDGAKVALTPRFRNSA